MARTSLFRGVGFRRGSAAEDVVMKDPTGRLFDTWTPAASETPESITRRRSRLSTAVVSGASMPLRRYGLRTCGHACLPAEFVDEILHRLLECPAPRPTADLPSQEAVSTLSRHASVQAPLPRSDRPLRVVPKRRGGAGSPRVRGGLGLPRPPVFVLGAEWGIHC